MYLYYLKFCNLCPMIFVFISENVLQIWNSFLVAHYEVLTGLCMPKKATTSCVSAKKK
jgi:hypothetical protein